HICALAIVAARSAIADVHLPSAMPTSEKAREQQLSLSGSTTSCAPFARSIIGDHDLISLKLVPRDVTLVMIRDEYLPFRLRTAQTTAYTLAAIIDDGLAGGANDPMKLARRDGQQRVTPGEQPRARLCHPPVVLQDRQQTWRQHCVAVPPALALLDA